MNPFRVGLLVLSLTAVCRAVAGGDELPVTVLRVPLEKDRTTPYVVLTNPNEVTTIEVPYLIESWGGRGLTEDPTGAGGDFFLRFPANHKMVFVSPLVAETQRTLHLVMQGASYPIELRPALQAYAFRRVVFFDPAAEQEAMAKAAEKSAKAQRRLRSSVSARASEIGGVQRLDSRPQQQMTPATPELQLALLRFMQMLSNLPSDQAEKAVRSNPSLRWSVRATDRPDEAGEYAIVHRFCVRNDTMKSLGVAVAIVNHTNRRLTFMPDSFVLRSGSYVYPQTAVDFNPVVEPGATVPAFFVIGRTPDGGGVPLAPDTPMQISMMLLKTANPAPAQAYDLQPELQQDAAAAADAEPAIEEVKK